MVQNANIKMENVFVPIHNKLTHALNFEKSANRVLMSSRLGLCWGLAGACAQAYEKCIEYCLDREQF